jgi:hypothetical protein
MLQLTQSQMLENCEVALAMVRRLADHQFSPRLLEAANWDLIAYGPLDDASVGALDGWCAQHPHFAQYGVYADPDDGLPKTAETLFPSDVAQMLFGDDTLFNPVGLHEQSAPMRQVCILRLQRAIERLASTHPTPAAAARPAPPRPPA